MVRGSFGRVSPSQFDLEKLYVRDRKSELIRYERCMARVWLGLSTQTSKVMYSLSDQTFDVEPVVHSINFETEGYTTLP